MRKVQLGLEYKGDFEFVVFNLYHWLNNTDNSFPALVISALTTLKNLTSGNMLLFLWASKQRCFTLCLSKQERTNASY